jgi:hypothetical protein
MSAMQSNDPDGRVGVCLQSRSSEGIAASSHIIPRKHMSDLFVSDKLSTETRQSDSDVCPEPHTKIQNVKKPKTSGFQLIHIIHIFKSTTNQQIKYREDPLAGPFQIISFKVLPALLGTVANVVPHLHSQGGQ